jgi:activating molecule in BECN1-regulated autophagy protein 1
MRAPCLLWPAYVKRNIPHGNDLTSSSSSEQRISSSLSQNPNSDADNQQPDQFATPMDVCPRESSASNDIVDAIPVPVLNGIETHAARGQPDSRLLGSSSINNLERFNVRDDVQMSSMSNPAPIHATTGSSVPDDQHAMSMNTTSGELDVQMFLRTMERGQHGHYPLGETRSWEVPFLQGWLMAQNRTDLHPALVNNNVLEDLSLGGTAAINNLTRESQHMHNFGHPGAPQSIPITTGSSRGSNRRYALRSIPGAGNSLPGPQIDESELHTASLGAGSELAASLFAVDSTELPCTVKIKIWRHDIKNPCVYLEPGACCLTISHAVLCRCVNVLLFSLHCT